MQTKKPNELVVRSLTATGIALSLILFAGCTNYRVDKSSRAEFRSIIGLCLISKDALAFVKHSDGWSEYMDIHGYELRPIQTWGEYATPDTDPRKWKTNESYRLPAGTKVKINSIWKEHNVSGGLRSVVAVTVDGPMYAGIKFDGTELFFPQERVGVIKSLRDLDFTKFGKCEHGTLIQNH